MNSLAAVVLAGGKGTRMQSDLPKVLHPLKEKPIIFHTLENLQKLDLKKIYIVVPEGSGQVKSEIFESFKDVSFVEQEQPIGTANAVQTAVNVLDFDINTILVLNGDDSAFYKSSTIEDFIKSHQESKSFLSMGIIKNSGQEKLGMVLRDSEGNFLQILEHNQYISQNIKSNENNCGLYIFNVSFLKENLEKIPLSDKGEYYLTELFNIAVSQNIPINLFEINNEEWISINTPEDLEKANDRFMKDLSS
jgi:bifunctional UDP-N-acetylglucosamine pyrophosphorylase / glucosamine-1-phosphate N-acetyltransferase